MFTAAFGVLALLCAIAIVGLPLVPREDPTKNPGDREVSDLLVEDVGQSTLQLPGEIQSATVSFTAKKGEKRVVTLDTEITFSADSGRKRALYATVGIACGPVDGDGPGAANSGTENLVESTTRELQRTVVYTAPSAGPQRCNARFSAKTWDADYADAKAYLVAHLATSVPAEPFAYEARPEQDGPVIIESGEGQIVIDEVFSLDTHRTVESMTVSISSHLTSCVIENGSKDGTEENLCRGSFIDWEGSRLSSSVKVELLDGADVCREMMVDSELLEIDHLVHHRMLNSRHSIASFLDAPCGDRIRVQQDLRNDGPAAVVLHRGSSSVVLSGQVA